MGPGGAGRPPKGLLASKAFQHAAASADEPLTERGECRLVLLGAGRHCSALRSPFHSLEAAPGPLQPLTLSDSSCLRCLQAVWCCLPLCEPGGDRIWLDSTNISSFNLSTESPACDNTERRRQKGDGKQARKKPPF